MIKTIKTKVRTAAITGGAALGAIATLPFSVAAQGNPDCDITTGSIQQGANCAANEEQQATSLFGTSSIFERVANALLFLVGAISVIMLIIGGIRYVVSAGDQNAVQGAKNTILYAIVGIVVAFLAYAAVDFVTTQLGDVTS